jgi:hypothetical protein
MMIFTKIWQKLTLIATIGSYCLSGGISLAQPETEREWQTLVLIYLADAVDRRLAGYELIGDNIDVGRLLDGDSYEYDVTIASSSQPKAFLAVCDYYCTDIDLRLYRQGSSTPILSDLGSDDEPVIYIQPGTSGRFILKISMEDCITRDACYYGIGFLGR